MERETAECGPERMVELLLGAVPEDLDRFERLCGNVQDWEKLIAYARSQGVAGVIWHYLAHAEVAVAPELKREAGRYLGVERLRQARLRAALDEALQALDAAGARTVALKRPALGDRIYPRPSLRPSIGKDPLVTPADLDR